MRTNAGGIAVAIVALFLGLLAVTQVRTQDVYTRSLELETPASLTTLTGYLPRMEERCGEPSDDHIPR